MSLTPLQQFQELLKKTTSPLILIPQFPSRDALASAFALHFFLEKSGKHPILAGENIAKDKESLSFLNPPENLLSSITGAREFVLSFNTERNPITNVRTETVDRELRIYLTPEKGAIDPRDFSFIPAKFKFDLAIVISAPDKEHLGKIYEDNPDIFYEIPIINIDNHSDNELFGQINLVDITASSSAEILAEALDKTDSSLIDERIAENLLAGIVSATESFQKKNTTPKALQIASRLMDHGADHERIVRSLYKTQPLHLLKLWGRVMAQVKWNEDQKLIWATVSLEDLVQSRATSADLPQVLEKIRNNYSSALLYLILYPHTATEMKGIVKAATPESFNLLAERFKGSEIQGDILLLTLPATSLEEAERFILDTLNTPLSGSSRLRA